MVRLTILIVLAIVSGCGGPQNQTHEITGTTAERVAAVSRVIESSAELPSTIQDARLIELQLGDGYLGPSDFQSFIWIKILPDQVERWRSTLKSPPFDSPTYETPPTKPQWWLSDSSFIQLTKYDSRALLGRNGWIVIQEDGNIFAKTYTQ